MAKPETQTPQASFQSDDSCCPVGENSCSVQSLPAIARVGCRMSDDFGNGCTRKGAGRMLDELSNGFPLLRLMNRRLEKLSAELQWQLSRSRAAEVLCELLRNLHRLEISTLDSFFSRVAKAFSLELGLPRLGTSSKNNE